MPDYKTEHVVLVLYYRKNFKLNSENYLYVFLKVLSNE